MCGRASFSLFPRSAHAGDEAVDEEIRGLSYLSWRLDGTTVCQESLVTEVVRCSVSKGVSQQWSGVHKSPASASRVLCYQAVPSYSAIPQSQSKSCKPWRETPVMICLKIFEAFSLCV